MTSPYRNPLLVPNGIPPLSVNFLDASAGAVTNRFWDFGDDSTSSDPNPVHIDYGTGSYTVGLTVWAPLASNTLSPLAFITMFLPPTNGVYAVVSTYSSTNQTSGNGVVVPSQTDIIGTGGLAALTDTPAADGQHFDRIGVHLP